MEAVFLKLLNMSISAGWLILAVVVFRILLKKAPKAIRCVLWALVGIRLICPFSFESALSLIPSAETVSPDILYSQTPTIHTGIGALNQAANPIISEHLAPVAGVSVNPLQVLTSAASAVWIAGTAMLFTYAVVSYLRLRRRVSTAMRLRDNLWLCDQASSPFILGFVKPRIYLPSDMNERQLSHVVAHENAHIRRHDHWWKPIGFILLAVYWFNPMIWMAYILLCRDIELACDEKVVKEMGTAEKKAYSEALLACSAPQRMIAAYPLAFGEVGVKERINNVLNYKKSAFWIIVAAATICVILAVCFLTNPKDDALYAPKSFGHSYSVAEISYDAPQYSFAYTPDTAPRYCLTADYALMVKDDMLDERSSADWLTLGSMTEIELTKDNFDRYFEVNGAGIWQADMTSRKLRSNNEKAWQLLDTENPNSVFYYLLHQKNGDVYLTYGYYDTEGTDPAFDDSSIRWLFKLAMDDESEDVSAMGGADAPKQAAASEASQAQSALDLAISNAILEHNKGHYSNGDFACESHVTLATLPIERWDENSNSMIQTVEVYLMALYQEYQYSGNGVSNTGGSHIPCVLTFDDTEAGYVLTNYWEPRDGSYYKPDIEKRFRELGATTIADALDTQKFILAQIQSCYAQAVEYGKVDTGAVIASLLETICSSPAEASSPGSYIDAHPIEYRELTYYGDYTLHHVFSKFLKGVQTDLNGHIMRIVMEDLIGGEALGNEAETGQAYFDAWLENARRIKEANGTDYMKEYAPKSWLLLQMIEE